jgi:NTE family protein
VVGAAYAVSGSAAELEARMMEFLASDLYRNTGLELVKNAFNEKPETWTHRLETWLKKRYLQAKVVARQAVLDSSVYREMIAYFIPDINIEDLPFPMWITGTDLRTGRPVAFKSGSLRDAVYGSSAIPGVVLPLEKNGMLVVDGGVVNMVPSLPVRHLGADVVLAVDVDKPVAPEDGVDNAFELLFRVEDIQGFYLKELQLREADLVLRPHVGHIHWSDFARASEMIRLGKDAAQEQLDAIIALSRRRMMPWRRWTPVLRDPALDWISV